MQQKYVVATCKHIAAVCIPNARFSALKTPKRVRYPEPTER